MLYFIYNDDIVIGFYLNNVPYFYVKNTQNDILAIVDENNNIDVSSDMNHIANINPFRYRSYYYDIETGLYYLNSRYYNPQWKRFLNADGIIGANEDIIGYNLYSYVSNNAVTFIDSNGKWKLPSIKKIWKAAENATKVIATTIINTTNKSVYAGVDVSKSITNNFVAEVGFGKGAGISVAPFGKETGISTYKDISWGIKNGKTYKNITGILAFKLPVLDLHINMSTRFLFLRE